MSSVITNSLKIIKLPSEAPRILNGGNYEVIEGEEAQILCQISGTPLPVITWQRNGIHIESEGRFVVEEKVHFIPLIRIIKN